MATGEYEQMDQKTYNFLLKNLKGYIFFVIGPDAKIQFCNDEGADLLGYTVNELIGKPFSKLYSEEDKGYGKPQEILIKAIEAGTAEEEGWRIKKDKTTFWAHITVTPIYNDQSQLFGYSCVIRDTTASKQHEINLIKSEERFRLLVQSVKDYAIFMLDANGYIVTWNDGAQKIKGYAPYEIIGKHFSTFYIQEDKDSKKPERELKIAVEEGKYEEEGWRVRKNGSLFWANVVITSLFNARNEHIGFSKVTRDLTDKKAAEEVLKASEEQYRLLVNSVMDYGIFMLDPTGRVVSWNEGAERINGYKQEEVIGKHFSLFYLNEDIYSGKPERELRIAIEKGKYEEEGWRLRKDKTTFWANVVITAVYNAERQLIGFSKVTRDLSERRKSERALKESEEKYKLANIALLHSNEELEQFTTVASHDLQEPLRTISSYLQLIEKRLKGNVDPEVKGFIDSAVNAGKRMKDLILNLLEYSKLSREGNVQRKIEVDKVIEEVLENLENSIHEMNAEIKIENTVESVTGDRIQLLQLFQNLIGNALKFKSDRPLQITIKGVEVNNIYKFSISDNGIGMKEEYLTKIFEVFKRLHTKNEYPGTGIGLAICKKIIEHHHGEIWAESELGKGTTFYFTLNKEMPLSRPLLSS